MKLVFAGTPEFAAVALRALHAAGHTVLGVMTQPDRPAGRGLKLQASAVKLWAQRQGVPVLQARSLRLDGKAPEDAAQARDWLSGLAPDCLVVAAYGLILPAWVLALPPAGCINIHASLLPRWRGAAPIHRAIEAGDSSTGITIMQMDEGLDTGAMLLSQAEAITAQDTLGSLHDRLAALGGRLVVQALAGSPLVGVAQPAEGVSCAAKVSKAETVLDWQQPAAVLERRLRAFDPSPGNSAAVLGQAVKLWRGRVVPGRSQDPIVPGQRLPSADGQLVIACGQQALELQQLQLPGGRRISASEFLRQQGGV